MNDNIRAWKLLYRFMDNVKTYMDAKNQTNKQINNNYKNDVLITIDDLNDVMDYINKGISDIKKYYEK